jgi:hypothetical protein
MLKHYFFSFLLLAAILFVGSVEAQAQSKWQLGGAFSHGNKAENFGIHLRPAYKLFDRFHVTPSATFFFNTDIPINSELRVRSFNIDGNYFLDNKDSLFETYLLAGLNFTRRKIVSTDAAGFENTNKSVLRGLNLGAGANLRLLKNFAPFAEARYTVGGYSQFEIMAGVKF